MKRRAFVAGGVAASVATVVPSASSEAGGVASLPSPRAGELGFEFFLPSPFGVIRIFCDIVIDPVSGELQSAEAGADGFHRWTR